MTEKKPLEVPFEDIKQGPIHHREGLQPDEIPVVVGYADNENVEEEEDVDEEDVDEEDVDEEDVDDEEEDDDDEELTTMSTTNGRKSATKRTTRKSWTTSRRTRMTKS